MSRAIMIVRLQALAVFAALSVGSLAAQQRARISGSIETGAAAIEQPLVRSGAAFYLSTGAQLTARDMTIGGDAVFATGTPIWKSFLGGGYIRSPAFRNVRLIGFPPFTVISARSGAVARMRQPSWRVRALDSCATRVTAGVTWSSA